jgi:hypothetical protein
MNDVMSKLQAWLNGVMTGDQITKYCAEMGIQFYPGFNFPKFPNSSPGPQDDGNGDVTVVDTFVTSLYRKAFESTTRPKTFGDSVWPKYADAAGKDFDEESEDNFGAQSGQRGHGNSQSFGSGRRMGFSDGKPHSRRRHASEKSGYSSEIGSDQDDDDFENESCNGSNSRSQAAFHNAMPRHAGHNVRGNPQGRGPGRGGLTGGRYGCGGHGHPGQYPQGAWDVLGVPGVINSRLVRESKKFMHADVVFRQSQNCQMHLAMEPVAFANMCERQIRLGLFKE